MAPEEGTGMTEESTLRMEYYILAQLVSLQTGGIDRPTLVALLREARGALPDEDYAGLQGDIMLLLHGG